MIDNYEKTMQHAFFLDANGEDGALWLSTKSMADLATLKAQARQRRLVPDWEYIEQAQKFQHARAKNGDVIKIVG